MNAIKLKPYPWDQCEEAHSIDNKEANKYAIEIHQAQNEHRVWLAWYNFTLSSRINYISKIVTFLEQMPLETRFNYLQCVAEGTGSRSMPNTWYFMFA